MALSSFVFSAMSFLVRLAKEIDGVTFFDSAFFRFAVGIAVVAVYWRLSPTPIQITNWRWLALRGSVGGAAVLLYFYGIIAAGLAKGTILNYTYPIWAAILAPFLLRERVRPGLWIAVIAAFAGLYLLVVPSEGIGSVTHHDLIALAGGFLAGIAVLAIKRLRDTESSWTIFLSQSVFGLAMVGYWTAQRPFRFPVAGWVVLVSIGAVATVGQLLMTYSYKHVGGTEGSLLGLLTPVGNVIVGVTAFGEAFSARALCGGVVVLLACAYAAIPPRHEPSPAHVAFPPVNPDAAS